MTTELNTQAPSRTGISRREALKRGAILGGAVWAAPMVQTIGARAMAQQPTPRPGGVFFTGGGGVDCDEGTLEVVVIQNLFLDCDLAGEHRFRIRFEVDGANCTFELDDVSSISCNVNCPEPPAQPTGSVTGTGTGELECPGEADVTATIEFTFTDAGEPGTDDKADFTITTDETPPRVFSCAGNLAGPPQGNFQAHCE